MKPYTIETKNGVYKLKRPVGRIGMIHFAILAKVEPKSKEKDKSGNIIMSPADETRFNDGYQEWCDKVLKNLLIAQESYLYDVDEKTGAEIKVGITYDDIPGEDQYLLFMAVASKTNVDEEEPFRFV